MDDFDEMMGFDKLDLYFEVQVAGFDGECFLYSIYFEDDCPDDKLKEINTVIDEFFEPYNDEENYLGYIDITKKNEKVEIYLDTGNVEPEDIDTAVTGILKALNAVGGIKSVVVNE
ncbi:MAG: hypothetical protein NC225_04195 [Clostridium sp.]|nr:hypothetical protein [Clostridium sp.]MCM1398667.1 hypothetical protein [Clostridium sp.]MCM1458702.1 hypothetical protein [Bacteroides sp.]